MTSALRHRLWFFTRLGLALLVPVIWVHYRPVDTLFDVSRHPFGVDFANIWAAPRIAAQHGVMILFDHDAYHDQAAAIFGANIMRMEWSYPPTMLLFATPLSLLPYYFVLMAWTLAGFALYAAVMLQRGAPAA